jgi:hypothetical protein
MARSQAGMKIIPAAIAAPTSGKGRSGLELAHSERASDPSADKSAAIGDRTNDHALQKSSCAFVRRNI